MWLRPSDVTITTEGEDGAGDEWMWICVCVCMRLVTWICMSMHSNRRNKQTIIIIIYRSGECFSQYFFNEDPLEEEEVRDWILVRARTCAHRNLLEPNMESKLEKQILLLSFTGSVWKRTTPSQQLPHVILCCSECLIIIIPYIRRLNFNDFLCYLFPIIPIGFIFE